MALMHTPPTQHGMSFLEFQNVLALDGKRYSTKDFVTGKPVLVMFICNHCPYVKAIESRLVQLVKDLKHIHIDVIGICSNDAENYPEDSYENLKARVQKIGLDCIYLYDEDQNLAKGFGAVCTPDFFLFDANHQLQYRGRLDDSWKDETKVTERELFNFAKAMVEGRILPTHQNSSMGCSIKWRNP